MDKMIIDGLTILVLAGMLTWVLWLMNKIDQKIDRIMEFINYEDHDDT